MTTNQTVHTLNSVKNNIYNIIRNHHLMELETPVYEEKKIRSCNNTVMVLVHSSTLHKNNVKL